MHLKTFIFFQKTTKCTLPDYILVVLSGVEVTLTGTRYSVKNFIVNSQTQLKCFSGTSPFLLLYYFAFLSKHENQN